MSEECEGSGGYGCGVSAFHCECESRCRIQRPTKDEAMVAPLMTSAAMATGSGHGRSPSGVGLMPPRGKLILVKRPGERTRKIAHDRESRFLFCTSDLKRYGTCIGKATKTYIWYVTSSVFRLGFHGKRN